jgi:hypothetical protein
MGGMVRGGAGRMAIVATGCLVVAGGVGYWRYEVARRPLTLTNLVRQDTGGLQDNSTCLVCHIDLETEDLVAAHLKGGIVCASCHGNSETHRSDELNITKPDMLFGRSEIRAFCKSCHPTHKSGTQYQAFVKEWSGRRRPNGRMVLADSICTDCHGNHVILRPDQQSVCAQQ